MTQNGNYLNPTYQQIPDPKLTALFEAAQQALSKTLNCARIGVIQAFNAGGAGDAATVDVKIAQQQVTSIAPNGVRTLADYPVLLRVPVLFPSGGGVTLTFPIAVGDECLVVFNDRALDDWVLNGPGSPPSSSRLHDLSDGIAIVGLRSNPRALENISTTAAQLRSDDGTTFIEVSGPAVKIHGGTVYEWDCHGYGQKITWTGGVNYTIDNYTTGAVVTTNTHAIQPPGPPA